MFNVLIVDDQKHIRDGLSVMLTQFSLLPENIYCAQSGKEALSLIRQHRIQLVITDIMMPEMDGLALIRAIKAENTKTQFIIISGYNEFSYAQQAIGLGAKNYLLKPVKREDLQVAVEQVWHDIQLQQSVTQNIEQLSQQERETNQKLLQLYMQGAQSDETWITKQEQALTPIWQNYRLCLIRKTAVMNQTDMSYTHQVLTTANRLFGQQSFVTLLEQPQLVLAVTDSFNINELYQALLSVQINVVIAITEAQVGFRRLPQCYAQVMELYRHSYLFPEKQVINLAHIERLEQRFELPFTELYQLFEQLGTSQSGKISQSLSSLFNKERLQRYHIRYTQQLCRVMIQMIEEHIRVIRPYINDELFDLDCLRQLFDYASMRDYVYALQQQLLRLNQFFYEYKCSYRNSKDLNEAIRFIHESYYKPIDLAIVSNHVSLNYAYFSNLFKKNVGKSFSEYLRDVRLDKARRLLAETDYKVGDIALMVGYETYKRFARSFREVMNMQPSEYRQLMQQKLKDEDECGLVI